MKLRCTAANLDRQVTDSTAAAASTRSPFKERKAFATTGVVDAGNQSIKGFYNAERPMLSSDYKFCQQITHVEVIDVSTPGAVKYSDMCAGKLINNSTGTNCGKLDFIWSPEVRFPLTFKVKSTIEGVYNHTSAEVTVTQEAGIDACDYVQDRKNSTCGATKCCGRGTRADGRK